MTGYVIKKCQSWDRIKEIWADGSLNSSNSWNAAQSIQSHHKTNRSRRQPSKPCHANTRTRLGSPGWKEGVGVGVGVGCFNVYSTLYRQCHKGGWVAQPNTCARACSSISLSGTIHSTGKLLSTILYVFTTHSTHRHWEVPPPYSYGSLAPTTIMNARAWAFTLASEEIAMMAVQWVAVQFGPLFLVGLISEWVPIRVISPLLKITIHSEICAYYWTGLVDKGLFRSPNISNSLVIAQLWISQTRNKVLFARTSALSLSSHLDIWWPLHLLRTPDYYYPDYENKGPVRDVPE